MCLVINIYHVQKTLRKRFCLVVLIYQSKLKAVKLTLNI